MRCREEDLYLVAPGMPFHQHFEVRTLHSAADVLVPDYFLDVKDRLCTGNCLHVTGYVNDHWRDVVFLLPWVRVQNVSQDAVALVPTQTVVETGKKTEVGFIVEQATPIVVRFDGRTAGTFDTMAEAKEFMQRDGYSVRRKGSKAIVQQRGADVEEFPDVKSAWAWVHRQMKAG